MRKAIFIAIGIVALISCEKDQPQEETHTSSKEIKKSEKNVPERFLRIDGKTDTLRNYELGKNLFGKFFSARAEFYVIENPNKTIYNQPVKSITLYFLDGMLAKTKYELEEDISDDLIHSYGNFTIKGYDSLTRHLFKTEEILALKDHKRTLNKNLRNYELKWELDSKFIYTRVNKSAIKKRFEYIETLKEYESKFKRVENMY